jgi:hypothetical protein
MSLYTHPSSLLNWGEKRAEKVADSMGCQLIVRCLWEMVPGSCLISQLGYGLSEDIVIWVTHHLLKFECLLVNTFSTLCSLQKLCSFHNLPYFTATYFFFFLPFLCICVNILMNISSLFPFYHTLVMLMVFSDSSLLIHIYRYQVYFLKISRS